MSSYKPCEHKLRIPGSGFTKKIIAEKSQRSLSAIIIHTTCHPRMLINHITSGVGYKNIQTRHHCTSHLKTYLDVHGIRSRHTIETTAGLLDAIEKAINRALVDVNPAVRDLGRAAFWSLQAVWPQRAATIMNELDGVARKQLEKANPHDSNDGVIPATARPSAPKKAGSAMSLLLAEKRKAKAAELAAGRIGEDSARTVSSPMPDSPSLQSGIPRSTCSTSVSAARQTAPIKGSAASTQASPGSPRQTPLPKWTQPSSSPQDFLQRSHSSNLGRTPSTSPSSSLSSVTSRNSPLRQTSTLPSGIRSPASSSGTSGPNTLRTPTLFRKPLPSFNGEPPVGIGIYASPEAAAAVRTDKSRTSARDSRSVVGSAYGIVEDALHAQAAQAVSAAQQLLEFAEDDTIPSGSMTPLRPTKAANGNLLKTPVNGNGFSRPWEESPRSQAMTPMMLDKLRERKHERSWWLKRQQRKILSPV